MAIRSSWTSPTASRKTRFATPTARRNPLAELPHPELQLRGVGHHAAVPDGIEHDFDVGVLHTGERLDLVLHVRGEYGAHTAAGSSEGHLHLHVVTAPFAGDEPA